MSDPRPVGLFDSGVGGLTVSREVFRLMPAESTIYFADNIHVPYGPRRAEELVEFAGEIVSFLISRHVKYIIFACNTNSSVSLHVMRERFSGVPMIGLVEPGAQEALRVSASKRIGLIATEATVKSGAYQRAIMALDPAASVFSLFAPRLVPLVEAGRAGTAESLAAVKEYVEPLRAEKIDTLILGCTHYPFLNTEFHRALPGVTLIDPATVTVQAAREEMIRLGLSSASRGEPPHQYFASGDPRALQEAAGRFLGREIPPVRQVRLD
ncbi:glutamate racemase [Desulfotomaculum copahuensis]|uniref:Glutamate racemase n=1 Tax=Desulfotomaculum copahuensis TaxID=1838280 RepID=A0A1B7LF19_9FIRM|nr:glutamate racemase [Desulfotomaculum copahuensis]OAT82245.1 glutamate racemase [Desulfotomaculum copahuensis]